MLLTVIALAGLLAAQLTPAMEALVAALRPVLIYPSANAAGDLPSDNSAESRWFVVWPAERDDSRVIVRANPLHPDVQKMSAEAMEDINAAVTAAERRAQAAYDRAIDQLRKTGKSTELEPVTLDDEGIAGERIDAELEVTIELTPVAAFELISGAAPAIQAVPNTAAWRVSVPANTYRLTTGTDRREHFRAAESRLYFGVSTPPTVARVGDEPRYRVHITPSATAICVTVRGHEALVGAIVATTDWSQLAAR
jgi:hypothetical protein